MLNAKETTTLIRSIKTRSGNLSTSIHQAAVACLGHIEEHGNLSLATMLHDAVSNTYKGQLKRWFSTFGPITWNKKEGQFRKVKSANAIPFDLDGAGSTSLEELKARTAVKAEYSTTATLAAVKKYLLKTQKAATEAGNTDLDVILEKMAAVIDEASA